MQEPGKSVSDSYGNRYLLIDAVGAYGGAAATLLKLDGPYFVEISQASGAYQVSVDQPMPDTVTPVNQQTFSGKGQQVSKPFTLTAGSYTVTAQNDSTALRVRLYALDTLGGSAVVSDQTGYYGDELMDTTIPPSFTSVPITVQSDGIFLFYVDPGGTGSGNWTVTVQ